MTAWEMYWISRLDAIKGFMFAFFFVSFVCLSFNFIVAVENEGEVTEPVRKTTIFFIFLAAFFLTAFCLIPSTKDMKEIYGIEQTQTGGEK